MPHVDVLLKQIRVGKGWKTFHPRTTATVAIDWRALPEDVASSNGGRAASGSAKPPDYRRRRSRSSPPNASPWKERRLVSIASPRGRDQTVRPLHLAVASKVLEDLKKPNTLRKYEAVLNRFLDYFSDQSNAKIFSRDNLQ